MNEVEYHPTSGWYGKSAPFFEGHGFPHASLALREQLVLIHRLISGLLFNKHSDKSIFSHEEDDIF